MKVNDIINRLKDTRGYITEQFDESVVSVDEEDNDSNMYDYMLDGIENAIQFFEEWLRTNEDFTD